MSELDDLRAINRAQEAVLELEAELVGSKTSAEVCKKCGQKVHTDADDDQRGLKEQLREVRQRFRDLRAGGPVANGDAAASPGTVEASAGVGEVG